MVGDESRSDDSLELQTQRVDRIVDLTMGIAKIKFSMNVGMKILRDSRVLSGDVGGAAAAAPA